MNPRVRKILALAVGLAIGGVWMLVVYPRLLVAAMPGETGFMANFALAGVMGTVIGILAAHKKKVPVAGGAKEVDKAKVDEVMGRPSGFSPPLFKFSPPEFKKEEVAAPKLNIEIHGPSESEPEPKTDEGLDYGTGFITFLEERSGYGRVIIKDFKETSRKTVSTTIDKAK